MLLSRKQNKEAEIKVNGCHYCLPYKFGSSHKGKNLLPSEQILYFKRRPYFGETSSPGKQTGSHENCLPLNTWRKKRWRCTHTPLAQKENTEAENKPRELPLFARYN